MRYYQRIIGVPGLNNAGMISTNIYRSAQPQIFEALPQYLRVKTVLNLRPKSEDAEVIKAGMKPMRLSLSALSYVGAADFDAAISVMNNPDFWPILVHCLQGHDRTGIICAAYRVIVDKWSLEEAEEEMQTYGFNDLWLPLINSLRRYVESKYME